MTNDTYEPTEGELYRGLAQINGDPELIELVEKGWWR